MAPILRLIEDVLPGGGPEVRLSGLPRMIYVVHGTVTFAGATFRDGEAWAGEDTMSFTPGKGGATCWRFELAPLSDDDGVIDGVSRPKLFSVLETLPKGDLLLRGDSVAFPPGGCAYLHHHQGPGIRCVIEGGIRIDTQERSISYGPGGAWYETGPDPVFAQAALDRPTRFVRVMILPLALLGKSSIQYLKDEDKAKPKSQTYQIYADHPIAMKGAAT
jgi:hypothetical protein